MHVEEDKIQETKIHIQQAPSTNVGRGPSVDDDDNDQSDDEDDEQHPSFLRRFLRIPKRSLQPEKESSGGEASNHSSSSSSFSPASSSEDDRGRRRVKKEKSLPWIPKIGLEEPFKFHAPGYHM